MTDTILDRGDAAPDRVTPLLFAIAIFTSAALVFVVQPMVTKLVLPMLGGSPSVWNTAMVFFQAALLAGYGYAHALQRITSIRTQVAVHLALLTVAALFLPLHINTLLGDPDPAAPSLWLLLTLAVSVGAPFAVLSATAPLLQAWYARVRAGHADGQNPYVLYAASNLGSFLALLAYPVLIEPLATLSGQRMGWSGGYAVFMMMVAALAVVVWRRQADRSVEPAPLAVSPAMSWRDRGILVLLAAAPSSLMLGVTAHLSTDVASAPFLWVVPLALYLLTFVVAFQARPWIPPWLTLIAASALVAVCVSVVAFPSGKWTILFGIHLSTFFFVSLLCHQTLAARRPAPDRLTEFYLLMSLGGVVGGAFTALLAPMIFPTVWEYPLVLVLVGMAWPWGRGRLAMSEVYFLLATAFLVLVPPLGMEIIRTNQALWGPFQDISLLGLAQGILGVTAICAFMLRERAVPFTIALAMIALSAQYVARGYDWSLTERSFFGVMKVANIKDPGLGGDVHVLMHGTTLHGSQPRSPAFDCIPTLYYAPATPIGQTTEALQARRGALRIGVVGQGSGAMAAYKREADEMTFFEIDPMVDRMSRDPAWFTYISNCAAGPIRTVLGDARLTLQHERPGSYDLLLIDAFSSDAVPTHLLTQEAIAGYLKLLKPDGVVILHLSNRNLEIVNPSLAASRRLGAADLHQVYIEDPDLPDMAEASTEALVLSPTPAGLAELYADTGGYDGKTRWSRLPDTAVRPWTDDYVNLFGAMWRNLR